MSRPTIWSITGNLLGAACLISLLAGCGAARSTWETVSPKKKVPPYEESHPAPAPQAVQPAPGPVAPAPPPPPAPLLRLGDLLPDAAFVATRHDTYRTRMEQWRELAGSFAMYDYPLPDQAKWDQCYELLTAVAKGYEQLAVMLEEDAPLATDNPAAPFAVLRQDITFAETQCESVFSVAAAALPGQLEKYRDIVARQGGDVLRYRQQQGDPAGVISAYENLRTANPEMAAGIEVRRIYGQALKDAGRLAEAADVLLEVAGAANAMEGWPLRLQAAEIFFALGDYSAARREYQHVARFFTALKREEGNIGQMLSLLDGHDAHGRELDLFRQALYGRLTHEAGNPPEAVLDSVRQLEEEFPASVYTEAARSLVAGIALPATVAPAEEAVVPGEPAPMGEVIVPPTTGLEEELESRWQEAEAMVDHMQFAEALALFEELGMEPSWRDRAEARIVEVSTQAATEVRKEAAALFLKARRQNDPTVKGRLLLESRRLLRQVTEKYPRAEIIDKVTQNLQAIEDELRQIDPGLLGEESSAVAR
ncbi:MAG: hypothetical protein ACOY4H_01775 [Thermodesulfobacteriota bacterium]